MPGRRRPYRGLSGDTGVHQGTGYNRGNRKGAGRAVKETVGEFSHQPWGVAVAHRRTARYFGSAPVGGARAYHRPAGTLAVLAPGPDGMALLIIRRADNLPGHPGEMAFPGGRWEPGDGSLWDTALREAVEEVGLDPGVLTRLGALEPVYIDASDMTAVCFAVWANAPPRVAPDRREVGAACWVALHTLAGCR